MKKHSASWVLSGKGESRPVAMNRTARQTVKKQNKLEHLPEPVLFPKMGKWKLKAKKRSTTDRLNDLLKGTK
jgi:hypothetical protein